MAHAKESYRVDLLLEENRLRLENIRCVMWRFGLTAHRMILASNYLSFCGLFPTNTKESGSGDVNLYAIDPLVMEDALPHIYTG